MVSQNLVSYIGLKTVQWTLDGQPAAFDDVGIDHGGFYTFVTKKLLDRANIITGFKQVGGEAMS